MEWTELDVYIGDERSSQFDSVLTGVMFAVKL